MTEEVTKWLAIFGTLGGGFSAMWKFVQAQIQSATTELNDRIDVLVTEINTLKTQQSAVGTHILEARKHSENQKHRECCAELDKAIKLLML